MLRLTTYRNLNTSLRGNDVLSGLEADVLILDLLKIISDVFVGLGFEFVFVFL